MEVNNALSAFSTEMKAQGIWDSITLVEVSDFGRTMPTNGLGAYSTVRWCPADSIDR